MILTFAQAPRDFKKWLGGHTALDSDDLALKHNLMGRDALALLGATVYCWMEIWPE